MVEYLYGFQPVMAALKSHGRKISQLLLYEGGNSSTFKISEIINLARQHSSIRIQYTTKLQLDYLCERRPHQNVALQVEPLSIRTVEGPPRGKLALLLVDIIDPQNLGSIIRSAAYFGVDNLYLTRGCSTLSPTVSKSSAGALEYYHERISYCHKENLLIDSATNKGDWKVFATGGGTTAIGDDRGGRVKGKDGGGTTLPVDLPIFNVSSLSTIRDNDCSNMVIFGNEGSGLKQEIVKRCHGIISIPSSSPLLASLMIEGGGGGGGRKSLDSLNVGVAAAIIICGLTNFGVVKG